MKFLWQELVLCASETANFTKQFGTPDLNVNTKFAFNTHIAVGAESEPNLAKHIQDSRGGLVYYIGGAHYDKINLRRGIIMINIIISYSTINIIIILCVSLLIRHVYIQLHNSIYLFISDTT